jgi:hypothetical protein
MTRTTLGEFLSQNELGAGEVDDIVAHLAHGDTYTGGGGAAPLWTVEAAL